MYILTAGRTRFFSHFFRKRRTKAKTPFPLPHTRSAKWVNQDTNSVQILQIGFLPYLNRMNYLAHAFLSFDRPKIIAGNLIADFVKGKQQFRFSSGVRRGITLHRAIDTFTDTHEATREAKKIFVPSCGRYSGAFLDIVYDHFLATDPRYFSEQSLELFAQHVYETVDAVDEVLPENFNRTFFYMQRQDWLSGYALKENIFNAFRGIYHRAKYLPEQGDAYAAFDKNYAALQHYYSLFMPDVINFSREKLAQAT